MGRRLLNYGARELHVARVAFSRLFSPPRGEKVPKADEGSLSRNSGWHHMGNTFLTFLSNMTTNFDLTDMGRKAS